MAAVQKHLRVGVVGAGEVAQVIHLPVLSMLSHLYTISIICDLSKKVETIFASDHDDTSCWLNFFAECRTLRFKIPHLQVNYRSARSLQQRRSRCCVRTDIGWVSRTVHCCSARSGKACNDRKTDQSLNFRSTKDRGRRSKVTRQSLCRVYETICIIIHECFQTRAGVNPQDPLCTFERFQWA